MEDLRRRMARVEAALEVLEEKVGLLQKLDEKVDTVLSGVQSNQEKLDQVLNKEDEILKTVEDENNAT